MLKLFHTAIYTPFQYPFTTTHGTKTEQTALLVALDFRGIPGFGEAPIINYYPDTLADMQQALEAKRQVIERYALMDPERFWHFLHHLYPDHPFLVAALDMAGWDLFAKMRRTTVRGLWNVTADATPLTSYTIGFDSIEAMQEKIKAHPWPVYKIKLTEASSAVRVIESLQQVTDAELRIDANGGWHMQEALQVIPELERLGITVLEQPLPVEENEAMPELKAKTRLILMADESCVGEKDVAKCAAGFHGVNIKLTKCSGMTPARRMITEARSLV